MEDAREHEALNAAPSLSEPGGGASARLGAIRFCIACAVIGLIVAASLWSDHLQKDRVALIGPEQAAGSSEESRRTPEPSPPTEPEGQPLPGAAADSQQPPGHARTLPPLPEANPAMPPNPDERLAAMASVPNASAPVPATGKAAVEEAHQVARRLVADFPDNPDAMEMMARVCLRFGQSASAVDYWRKCLEISPNYAYAYCGLAAVAESKGDQAEAVRLLRKALAIDPRSLQVQFDLAKAMVDQGQVEEAVGLLQTHVAMYPRSARGYVLLGAAQLQSGAFKEAKLAYEAAIKIDPLDDFPYLGLVTACSRLGEVEQSKRYREQFEKLRGGETQARHTGRDTYDDAAYVCADLAGIYVIAGRLYLAQGNRVEAEQRWMRAAAVAPQHVESRQALLRLYQDTGRQADRRRVLEQLARIVPAQPPYLRELGRMYMEAGEDAKGRNGPAGGLPAGAEGGCLPRSAGRAIPESRPQAGRRGRAGPEGDGTRTDRRPLLVARRSVPQKRRPALGARGHQPRRRTRSRQPALSRGPPVARRETIA